MHYELLSLSRTMVRARAPARVFMYLGHSNNFEKASRATTDAFGVGYDYGSVMHYSSTAFSKNGLPTIVPRVSSGPQ